MENSCNTKIENDTIEVIPGPNCVSEEEARELNKYMSVRTSPKGTILLHPGQIANECLYVLKGCIRRYYLMDGEEKTTQFYTENQSIFSTFGFTNKIPARYFLACVEETTMTVLPYEKELKLFEQFPRLESMCRVSIEEEFANYQEMMETYITSTPEERYMDLLKNKPDLFQRIPMYHLASYLGIKPESLSRIRRRILQKQQVA